MEGGVTDALEEYWTVLIEGWVTDALVSIGLC